MTAIQEKYFAFITSGGRTGTKFFGDLLCQMIPVAFSVHEPDVLNRLDKHFLRQLRIFGFYQMVLGRIAGKTGIRNLSQNYLARKIGLDQLSISISNQRQKYYDLIDQDLIIESYSGWYGCVPAIRQLFKNYKLLVVARNPKDWVRSNMNWGTMYGRRDWVSKLGLGRLNPKLVRDKQYQAQWESFSRFHKLCWAWKTIYETLLDSIKDDPNARIVKFEELFETQDKYLNLRDLLEFLTRFGDRAFSFEIPPNILEKKVHQNISQQFPNWKDWEDDRHNDLISICGGVMERLDYSFN